MTNDNPQGFTPAPFPQLAGAATTPPDPPKKRGGRRGPRGPKTAKRGRPPKKTITSSRVRIASGRATTQSMPDTGLKISVADAMSILRGLDAMESEALQKCLLAVAGLGKKSRERVLAALAKVVA